MGFCPSCAVSTLYSLKFIAAIYVCYSILRLSFLRASFADSRDLHDPLLGLSSVCLEVTCQARKFPAAFLRFGRALIESPMLRSWLYKLESLSKHDRSRSSSGDGLTHPC